jgi:hypothetical protein
VSIHCLLTRREGNIPVEEGIISCGCENRLVCLERIYYLDGIRVANGPPAPPEECILASEGFCTIGDMFEHRVPETFVTYGLPTDNPARQTVMTAKRTITVIVLEKSRKSSTIEAMGRMKICEYVWRTARPVSRLTPGAPCVRAQKKKKKEFRLGLVRNRCRRNILMRSTNLSKD